VQVSTLHTEKQKVLLPAGEDKQPMHIPHASEWAAMENTKAGQRSGRDGQGKVTTILKQGRFTESVTIKQSYKFVCIEGRLLWADGTATSKAWKQWLELKGERRRKRYDHWETAQPYTGHCRSLTSILSRSHWKILSSRMIGFYMTTGSLWQLYYKETKEY
jgi:hypothetical protein